MSILRDLIKNKSQLKLICGLLTLVIMVAVVMFMLVFQNRIVAYVYDNDLENAQISAKSFSALTNEQLRLVESMADEFGAIHPKNSTEITAALAEIDDIHYFGSLRFADRDGTVYDRDGSIYGANVTGLMIYEEALQGESAISKELMIDVSDYDKAIIMAAPVRVDNEITGVMLAYLYDEGISEIVEKLGLAEDNLVVMDAALNIIGKSVTDDFADVRNKFDYYLRQFRYSGRVTSLDVKNNIKNGESVVYPISYNGVEYLLLLHPLEQSGWSMAKFIPMEEVTTEKNYLMRFASIYSILVIVVFGMMFYIVYASAANMLELEALNAQYSLLDNENKSITFSYNPDSRAVELNGAVEQALGKEIASMGTINLVSLLDRLHESDQGLSKNIAKAVREGENKYETELRVRRDDGEYDWYKLEAVIVRDKRDKVQKIVGSLKNSEDQIAKEHVLKNKAERDLLTGLLNKVTMELSVEEALKKRPYSTFAFYIIDMDNFKAVNDNLGHATGDKVLVDVANKLTLLFNEYDYIGRLGGDEFAVMLVIPENMSNYSSRLIELKAKSLCENLKETYSDENISVTVSSSIGIAVYDKDGKNFEELYKHADQALYQSKNNGKDQYNFYKGELQQ